MNSPWPWFYKIWWQYKKLLYYQGKFIQDLASPVETGAVKNSENLPKYCDFCKFLLVEELYLEEDYRTLHYGKSTVIGKVRKTPDGNVLLENIPITNLPSEYSLPEGTLSVRLLTFSYFGTQLQNNKYVEITGEVVVFNTKTPKANHNAFLTAKSILEQLAYTKSEEDYYKLLKYFRETYKPAIKVWFVQQIARAGDLIQRNLELRMLQELMA